MAGKRKRQGDSTSRKRQWRADSSIPTGQGIFMTCNRGKERQAANEFIDILREAAASLYPELDLDKLPAPVRQPKPIADGQELDEDELRNGAAGPSSCGSSPPPNGTAEHDEDEEDDIAATTLPAAPLAAPVDDIEAELRAELAGLKESDAKTYGRKSRPNKNGDKAGKEGDSDKPATSPAFQYCDLATECVVFIKVHLLLDPFQLCYNYMEQVERTGEARSRIISRLSPVAGFCSAHSHELQALAGRVLPRFFLKEETGTFKIDPRIRSHNVLKRDQIIELIASAIPHRHAEEGVAKDGASSAGPRYRADLKNPTHWIVVEVHKSQAALGVLKDYNRWCKMNPLELANSVKRKRGEEGEGSARRVTTSTSAVVAAKPDETAQQQEEEKA